MPRTRLPRRLAVFFPGCSNFEIGGRGRGPGSCEFKRCRFGKRIVKKGGALTAGAEADDISVELGKRPGARQTSKFSGQ